MSTQTATTLASPKHLLDYLQKSRGSIEMALPKHLSADRMMRLALTCFSTQPALRQCTAQSILASIVVSSQLGLEIGVAGQAYLIPYKTTCTLVPGWQGLVGLLNNTGRATAWTRAVFEGDEFQINIGDGSAPRHVPGNNFGDADKMTGVYAVGKVNGSECHVVEYWPIARVWKHRDLFNKVGSRHYSFAHPEMYARKVVLLQVLKYMPRSIELNNAIAAVNAAENGNAAVVDAGVVVEVEPAAAPEPQFAPKTNDPDDAPPGAEMPPEVKPKENVQTELSRNLKALRMFLKPSGFTELHLLNLWRENGAVDESLSTLEEVSAMNPSVILTACNSYEKTLSALKKANAPKEQTEGGQL
jgi:recombination protein RecT